MKIWYYATYPHTGGTWTQYKVLRPIFEALQIDLRWVYLGEMPKDKIFNKV